MSDESKAWALWGKLTLIPLLMILPIPIYAWQALIYTTLWDWFLVPLGVPQIPFVYMWGIIVVMTGIVHEHSYRPPERTDDKRKSMAEHMGDIFMRHGVAPLFTLACGWAIKILFL